MHDAVLRAPKERAFPLLIPGLPQLLGGRAAAGGLLFGSWLFFLVIALVRRDRILAVLAGGGSDRLGPGAPDMSGVDAWLAVTALAAGLFGIWTWSIRSGLAARSSAAVGERASPRLRSFLENRAAILGLSAIVTFYLLALLTPLLAPFDPGFQGDLVSGRLAPPSATHPLGTDQFARDVLSRVLYGARISLAIGLIAVGISVTLGTFLGSVAGYVGGWVDGLIMRFVDVVISFPALVLLISIIALFEPSIFLIIMVLGLTQWPGTTRIVRAEVLSLREREFIEAGRALGFSRARIIWRHIVPNTMAPVIVAATLGIGDTIVLEAGLSFLQLGVQPPTPSWGIMVADGRNNLLGAWWIATFPGLAIVFTVLSFNLLGDGLRDALDPRIRQ